MNTDQTRDTTPPVPGAIHVPSGSDKVMRVLSIHQEIQAITEVHFRTEAFHNALSDALSKYGVGEVIRLCLMHGVGGREVLIVTIDVVTDNTVRTYTVIFPFNSDPFSDPGWVAAQIIQQSSAASMSLRPCNLAAICATPSDWASMIKISLGLSIWSMNVW